MKKAGGEKWEDLQKNYKNWLYSQDYSDIMNMKGKLSDYQARRWYITHDKNIPNLIDKTLPLEKQARQAHSLRNQYRTQARELMSNQEKRKEYDITDPNKSFNELLIDKMKRKHLTREEALQDIIDTATKTRKTIDAQFGLED